MIEFLDKFLFQYVFHLNFKSNPGFQANPRLNAFMSPTQM